MSHITEQGYGSRYPHKTLHLSHITEQSYGNRNPHITVHSLLPLSDSRTDKTSNCSEAVQTHDMEKRNASNKFNFISILMMNLYLNWLLQFTWQTTRFTFLQLRHTIPPMLPYVKTIQAQAVQGPSSYARRPCIRAAWAYKLSTRQIL